MISALKQKQQLDTMTAMGQRLHQRWNQPDPRFGSGTDPRTSEEGLLTHFYGGMCRHARFNWHNGGRTLIDKTYLAMLWQALALPTLGISFDTLAANLDNFIRQQLAPRWDQWAELAHEERHELAVDLVELAASQLFGSRYSATAASYLLLFLCPQLPVFAFSNALCRAVRSDRDGELLDGYRGYHRACRELLARDLPLLCQIPNPVNDSNFKHDSWLNDGDWWPRRLQAELLCQLVADASTNQQELSRTG